MRRDRASRVAVVVTAGEFSLKVHSQTVFKERHMGKPIVNTGKDFDEKSIAAQK